MLWETIEHGWLRLEQAERWDWGGRQDCVVECPGSCGEEFGFHSRSDEEPAEGFEPESDEIWLVFFGSTWPLCEEWLLREQEWKWGYHNGDLAEGERTKEDRFGVCVSGRADSTSWWIRGRRRGREESSQVSWAPQTLAFLLCPQRLKLTASYSQTWGLESWNSLENKCILACHWANETGELVYLFKWTPYTLIYRIMCPALFKCFTNICLFNSHNDCFYHLSFPEVETEAQER